MPTASIHLQPAVFRSATELPEFPLRPLFQRMPAGVVNALFRFADRVLLDPPIAPAVNEYRASLGLPPVRGIFRDYVNSPRRVIGMFPDWFAAKAPDWPVQARLAGFPLYDERGVEPLPAELQRFLDGDPPIAFTPGSAMVHGEQFFQTAADACVRLGKKGILLTRHGEQIPKKLPENVRHFAYAPFSELLPRCAALVHHGGIGTTSQALRAGTPQLIMPMSHDQPDNAMRVKKLGCGDSIARRKFKPKAVAEKLDRLLRNPMTKGACKACAHRFDHADALGNAAKWMEELIEARQPVLAT